MTESSGPNRDTPDIAAPAFDITERPQRRYSRTTVEYVGEVVFSLSPRAEWETDHVESILRSVLDEGPYRVGDWLDLPMPLFLVHDTGTSDTFRVAVRDGRIELHVLPATESEGLRALYRRLVATSDVEWDVAQRVTPPG